MCNCKMCQQSQTRGHGVRNDAQLVSILSERGLACGRCGAIPGARSGQRARRTGSYHCLPRGLLCPCSLPASQRPTMSCPLPVGGCAKPPTASGSRACLPWCVLPPALWLNAKYNCFMKHHIGCSMKAHTLILTKGRWWPRVKFAVWTIRLCDGIFACFAVVNCWMSSDWPWPWPWLWLWRGNAACLLGRAPCMGEGRVEI